MQRDEVVLVPTMTFAATAEVVRYFDAVPVFVDCDPNTLCMAPAALERVLVSLAAGAPVPGSVMAGKKVRAIITVHYGGQMVDVDAIARIAARFDVPVIEDAAHTMPARYRASSHAPWRHVGTTALITCFSFYANKCITTGEGGMAVTNDDALAARMRLMSLHGMSKDAWRRFMSGGSWYYEIVAPGFKYNLTDVAAAIGLCQLSRSDELWRQRVAIAARFSAGLADVGELILPVELPDRQHSWHLYAVRLVLERLNIDRASFIAKMNEAGVAASVHWMPLHMQPYYRDTFGYEPADFPVAQSVWPQLVSLPIFPGMTPDEVERVISVVRELAAAHRR